MAGRLKRDHQAPVEPCKAISGNSVTSHVHACQRNAIYFILR